MALKFSPADTILNGSESDLSKTTPFSQTVGGYALYDCRPDVMGARFEFDSDVFNQTRGLFRIPASTTYRIILVPKNDEVFNKRGRLVVAGDEVVDVRQWTMLLPVSDRFEYSDEALHYVNVSLLTQLRISKHIQVLHSQYGGIPEYVSAAFTAQAPVLNTHAFEAARLAVDLGSRVVLPSDEPAGLEIPEEEK